MIVPVFVSVFRNNAPDNPFIAISAGGLFTVSLYTDGTVVAVGYHSHGQCDVSGRNSQ